MARYNLSTLAARSAVAYVRDVANVEEWRSIDDVRLFVETAVDSLISDYPSLYPAEYRSCVYALVLSVSLRLAIDSFLTVPEYIAAYAAHKLEMYKTGDKGAFGDLYEILVRIALVGKLSLVRPSMLYVHDVYHTDIISRRFGRLEVGHNGKTLSFGTVFDFMDGPFDSIAYGVFEDTDKEEIVKLCIAEQIDKVIDYIRAYTVVWTDKYQFQADMDNLTRGQGIAKKGDDIQVVYNPGKHDAFINAIENGIFIPLADLK